MRGARLLEMLLLLQNRGRLTSAQLAEALEVSRRTILRDVDSMTEAGLPIIVHQGNQGGIELGFDYRSRLAAFDRDEAVAMGILLAMPVPQMSALGLEAATRRARAKLFEAFSDTVREQMRLAQDQFRFASDPADIDPRVPALARAIRERSVVRVWSGGKASVIHPVALIAQATGWQVEDGLSPGTRHALAEMGSINISAKRF